MKQEKEKKTINQQNIQKDDLSYGYYSKVLEKVFNTLPELKDAEKKHQEELEAKSKASELRKAEAVKVEDAFKIYNQMKKDAADIVYKAKGACAKAIRQANDELNKVIEDQNSKVKAAEDAYNKELKDFIAKHPEGYHVTLRDGDCTTTLDVNLNSNDKFRSIVNSFFDDFIKLW